MFGALAHGAGQIMAHDQQGVVASQVSFAHPHLHALLRPSAQLLYASQTLSIVTLGAVNCSNSMFIRNLFAQAMTRFRWRACSALLIGNVVDTVLSILIISTGCRPGSLFQESQPEQCRGMVRTVTRSIGNPELTHRIADPLERVGCHACRICRCSDLDPSDCSSTGPADLEATSRDSDGLSTPHIVSGSPSKHDRVLICARAPIWFFAYAQANARFYDSSRSGLDVVDAMITQEYLCMFSLISSSGVVCFTSLKHFHIDRTIMQHELGAMGGGDRISRRTDGYGSTEHIVETNM